MYIYIIYLNTCETLMSLIFFSKFNEIRITIAKKLLHFLKKEGNGEKCFFFIWKHNLNLVFISVDNGNNIAIELCFWGKYFPRFDSHESVYFNNQISSVIIEFHRRRKGFLSVLKRKSQQ